MVEKELDLVQVLLLKNLLNKMQKIGKGLSF